MKTMKLNVARVGECMVRPWPRNAVALRTAKTGDTIVGVDDRGLVYSNRVIKPRNIGSQQHRADLVSCLVKLRVLTDEQRVEWKKWAKREEDALRETWASECLLKDAKLLGLRLTPKQLQFLGVRG